MLHGVHESDNDDNDVEDDVEDEEEFFSMIRALDHVSTALLNSLTLLLLQPLL